MPKVSVLITFYNQAKYVDDALTSVAGQKADFNWEILIGDDGSTDGTFEKIEVWQTRYPDMIRIFKRARATDVEYDPIARASANRIALVKEAVGEYVLFLDGDDFFTSPHKLAKQARVLDSPHNADCVACAHAVDMWWEEDDRILHLNNPAIQEQKFTAERYWAVTYYPIHAFLFRNVFKAGFPDDMFRNAYFDDNMITCYTLKFGVIYYLPAVMARYRQHGASIWNSLDLVKKHVVCLLGYDAERKMAFASSGAINWRHRHNFKMMWRNRKALAGDEFNRFRQTAERTGEKEILQWLTYARQGPLVRLAIQLTLLKKIVSALCFRVVKHGYFKPGRALDKPMKSLD